MDLCGGDILMEFYDRTGNIKKVHVKFEPLKETSRMTQSLNMIHQGKTPKERRAIVLYSVCDDCKDTTCFYGRYKKYCSDNFIGKCDDAKLSDERQRLIRIILT